MNWRDQNLLCLPYEVVLSDHPAREFPVAHIGDHEFYLVLLRPQTLEIWPVVSLGLAGGRTFYIKYHRRARIDVLDRNKSARLDKNLVSAIAKLGNERKNI